MSLGNVLPQEIPDGWKEESHTLGLNEALTH